jgi:hypothetical protein
MGENRTLDIVKNMTSLKGLEVVAAKQVIGCGIWAELNGKDTAVTDIGKELSREQRFCDAGGAEDE